MKNKKYAVTFVSFTFFMVLLAHEYFAPSGYCRTTDYFLCNYGMDQVKAIGHFFGVVFIFSGITVMFSIFEKWWKFAMWGLPLSIFLIVGIYSDWFSSQSGGVDPFKTGFVALQVKLVYAFFITGSLIQLYRAYKEGRGLVTKKK